MLDLFTIIWGKMINSFLEVTLPSLMQPGNIPAAKELLHSYFFYSTDDAIWRISQHPLYSKLSEIIEANWIPLQKGEWETTSNILHQMKISASEGHYMLIMTPDIVVGNGSVLNIAKLCNGEYNPILFGFPRVNEEGWRVIHSLFDGEKAVSNRQLVTIAMKYIEQTTYQIENKASRWIVQNNAWVVKHNVPTPCLLAGEKIIKLFETNLTKNAGYDHVLPYAMVESGYPWYLIRHSGIYFQVERGKHLITEGTTETYLWQELKRLQGLEFFGKEEAIWQGV